MNWKSTLVIDWITTRKTGPENFPADERLSEAVGDDGGGGISAGKSSTRSGRGLGFDPRHQASSKVSSGSPASSRPNRIGTK